MKHIIITSSDAKYGDFLINHWLQSLKTNVNLSNIDILVLDYGLTSQQIEKLKSQNVLLYKCKKNGHVTSIRFRDMASFLQKYTYNQVLSTDGGDIIFQTDISHLFNEHTDAFRAINPDELPFKFADICLRLTGFFEKEIAQKIAHTLRGKKEVNAGILFGPYKKFIHLCKECNTLIKNKKLYGTDQVAVNYLLYQKGFIELPQKYNFIIREKNFFITDGIFYFPDGEIIPIVHNAGGTSVVRLIKKFGYGKEYNQYKKNTQFLLQSYFKTYGKVKKTLSKTKKVYQKVLNRRIRIDVKN